MVCTTTAPAGDLPWKRDLNLRKHREVMVPDTIEWSGKPIDGDPRRFSPIEFSTATGWELRMPCRDFKKGRQITVSSCTGLQTPIMPFSEDAWAFLEAAEAVNDTYMKPGWRIGRVDFARDLEIPESEQYLRDVVLPLACERRLPREVHDKPRQLGVTLLGVAGGDRLRIYHKGLEAMNKHKWRRMLPAVANVVRIELQLRKGQLDERHKRGVAALRSARVEPEPRETDVPTIRLRPRPGHGIKRRHLHAMKRDRLPQRALDATRAVDAFLAALGLDRLLPEAEGVTMPEPAYGLIVAPS